MDLRNPVVVVADESSLPEFISCRILGNDPLFSHLKEMLYVLVQLSHIKAQTRNWAYKPESN